jgi:hypothetical protein
MALSIAAHEAAAWEAEEKRPHGCLGLARPKSLHAETGIALPELYDGTALDHPAEPEEPLWRESLAASIAHDPPRQFSTSWLADIAPPSPLRSD